MSSPLNNFFSKIYCINLDRRKDRWEEVTEEFKKWDIEGVTRYPAIDGNSLPDLYAGMTTLPKSAIGLILTNIKILEEAKKQNLDSILIMEDDVVFHPSFSEIENKLSRVPRNWHCLYFGGNHNLHKGEKPPAMIDEDICRIHKTFTTHCVAIKSGMYKVILDELKSGVPSKPLDVIYTDLQRRFNFYCFYPAVALQRAGYSDIQNKVMDYEKWIK